jgi:hypothetical protein
MVTFEQLVGEMVQADIALVRREQLYREGEGPRVVPGETLPR